MQAITPDKIYAAEALVEKSDAMLKLLTIAQLIQQKFDDATCREINTRNPKEPQYVNMGEEDSYRQNPARLACSSCCHIDKCLEWALGNEETFGIWGGSNKAERNKIKKEYKSKVNADKELGLAETSMSLGNFAILNRDKYIKKADPDGAWFSLPRKKKKTNKKTARVLK